MKTILIMFLAVGITISATAQQAPKKAKAPKVTTTQCLGTTKAGTRCRHMTKNLNGYCSQHQPADKKGGASK